MLLLYFISVLSASAALFEDQVGKFDWRHQFVGCPQQVLFDRSPKGDRLILSTKENIFASLSTASGNINWRRIQEDEDSGFDQGLTKDKKNLFTISADGKWLRSWNKGTGAIRWQKHLDAGSSSGQPRLLVAGSSVVVLVDGTITSFNFEGDREWTSKVTKSTWSNLQMAGNDVLHASILEGILTVDTISAGKKTGSKSVAVKSKDGEKCTTVGSNVVCLHSDTVYSTSLMSPTLDMASTSFGVTFRAIVALDDSRFAAISSESTLVFSIDGGLNQIVKIDQPADAVALAANQLITVSKERMLGYNIRDGKKNYETIIPSMSSNSAPVSSIFVDTVKNEIEAFLVFQDCRTEFVVISIASSSLHSEWNQEQALARISSVEMIDLPLSESQQLIEDEFEQDEGNDNVITSFVRRVISQGLQLQKWVAASVNELISLSTKVSVKSTSFSDLLETVRNAAKATNGRGLPLERDFFNLRKMLVVTSLDGVVFGVDSSDGAVVWKLWLGSRFSTLRSEFGDDNVPLFIQRTTAHYQLNGQAAVVFKDVTSGAGILVFFNPINGAVVERKQLSSRIKRVDLLPFLGKDNIHSLLVVQDGDKVSCHPALPTEVAQTQLPVHVLISSPRGVSGARLNLLENSIENLWNADLQLASSEKIIAVKGKPNHQKIHSQGRVLIDRSVQYKYGNPNLVAVAALDDANQLLTIFMVDAVSGQIVHTAKQKKVSAPIHMVHCENWIAYSYWSERGRRTEIGVIELYEGAELSDKEVFDSLVPTKRAPEVSSESFIYAQGVEAMAVTETEQGLTTRAILLALPFGGIHEVSRKFLDANRPLELTQEMREEMMIPYMPEIAIATEDMVNYNQTVHKIRGIKTAPSGLESTSLMLAYGVDLFFTRLHPSGTFDILKDDFDHILISLVLFALITGSVVSKRLARNNALKAAWA